MAHPQTAALGAAAAAGKGPAFQQQSSPGHKGQSEASGDAAAQNKPDRETKKERRQAVGASVSRLSELTGPVVTAP